MTYVAMFTLLITFATQRTEVVASVDRGVDRNVMVASDTDAETFAERWPRPAAVESTSTAVPPVILVQDDDKPPASHRRHHKEHGDVCSRHGLRKVTTHNGRSWRCR